MHKMFLVCLYKMHNNKWRFFLFFLDLDFLYELFVHIVHFPSPFQVVYLFIILY